MTLPARFLIAAPLLIALGACMGGGSDSSPAAPGSSGGTGSGSDTGGTGGTGTGTGTGDTGSGTGSSGGYAATVLADSAFLASVTAEKTSTLATEMPGSVETLDGVLAAAALGSPEASALAGTAQYSGSIAARSNEIDGERYGYTADLSLTANFGSGALTGSITDVIGFDQIHDDPPGAIDSNLAVNGTITGGSLNATISGTLSEDGTAYAATGDMIGDFRGADAGTVGGLVTLSDATPGADLIGTMEGAFVATKTTP